ncbi:MAG TPA: PQQ-binding-like beta-propeller repeat protein, partial [Blastocatellia bacterium]|nr:PQQ-binding-like beta-propeller repeat protein [Blastocatellia bacterium]
LPLVAFAQPDVNPISPAQKKQQRKAEARQKAGPKARREDPAEAGATSTSRLALPFKRAWQYLTNDTSTLAPSMDDARIYLALAGGRVICLDRETGSLRWTSDPGGLISSPVAVGENSVYIATLKIADDGSEAGGSLRAVDKATGLTVWMKDYARPFASPLELAADRIYAGSADGSFYALRATNGDEIWKVETQDVVRGRALVTDRAIYFGGDDGALRAVEPGNGQVIWKHQAGGKVIGRPAIDEHEVYFGAGDGYVYSVDVLTGKLGWRSRTGAAIEASPVLVGERLLVASFDNFVYALDRSDGDRIWKRRLENRITAAPIVQGDASLVAPLRGDYVEVLLNSDGRRVNLFRLEKDAEVVADPVFSDDTVVIVTNLGIVVAKATRSADESAKPVKK